MVDPLRLGALRLLAAAAAGRANRPLVQAYRSATQLRVTGEAPERFRDELAGLLAGFSLEDAHAAVNYPLVRALLSQGTAYKYALFGDRWGKAAGNAAFRWLTRLAAASDITTDVMRLAAGFQIPPHAHLGVVSAMYLLDGAARVRTWDTLGDPAAESVPLRPQLDAELTAGQHTNSSEAHHNLHWLTGVAPLSLVLRFTISDVRSAKGERFGREGARCYLDPTATPDAATGLVPGRRISMEEALTLVG